MLKRFIFTMLLGGSLSLGAAAETSLFKVEPFQKIKVAGNLNVDCVHCPDSVGYIVVTAPHSAQLPWVEANVGGDKLNLKLAVPKDATTAGNLPSVKVYTKYLVKAENEGDSTLRVLTSADVPQFEARLIGNGRLSVRGIDAEKIKASVIAGHGSIALSGKALKATYSLAGSGTIEADALQTNEASIRMAGTGSIGVNAAKKLSISGAGSGTIFFRGAPEIKKSIAIGVKLQPIE